MSTAAIPSAVVGVGGGLSAIRATLRLMVALARRYRVHPLIREMARSLTSSCADHDTLCELASLQAYVRDHVRYVSDVAGVETLQTPLSTLGLIEQPDGTWRELTDPNGNSAAPSGDCDDQATLLAALCLSVGIGGRFCAIAEQGDALSHVLVEARLHSGDYVPLETIVPGAEPGWFPPHVTCFMVAHFG